MTDRFSLGHGEHADPAALPEHQRRLHRAQMAAIRAERQAALDADTDEQARWPGLVDPEEPPPSNQPRRTA